MSACLVLLDLQHGILRSGRIAWADSATPERVISTARSYLDRARSLSMPVIHVGVVRNAVPDRLDRPRTEMAVRSGKTPREMLPMAADTSDVDFCLPPEPGEEIVLKTGVSAFAGTRLEQLLRGRRAEDVLVCGVFTHMVVESTVRQGFDLGYRMGVLADACAALAPAPHDSALNIGIPGFARIFSGPAAFDEAVATFDFSSGANRNAG